MLDSEAVFDARALAVGVSQLGLTNLQNAAITTMAKLAYCTAAQPGTGDDQAFVDAMMNIYLLAPPLALPPGELACLRRLWF